MTQMAKAKVKKPINDVAAKRVSLIDAARSCLGMYGAETQVARAFPLAADGLLPVQRYILYSMFCLGMTPKAKYRKSAVVVGHVIGTHHPHGDSSCYASAVQMSSIYPDNDKLRIAHTAAPMIDFFGNVGDIQKPDVAAAMRYTEMRMTEYAEKVFFPKDLIDVVDYGMNYEGTTREPLWLVNTLPHILCAGLATGIAVGARAMFPSFDYRSVRDVCLRFAEQGGSSDADFAKLAKLLVPVHRYGGTCTSAGLPASFSQVDKADGFQLSWSCDFESLHHGGFLVTGMAPNVRVGALFDLDGKDGMLVVDRRDHTQGFGVELIPPPELDAPALAQWQKAMRKKLSSKIGYKMRMVQDGSVYLYTLQSILENWYDRLHDLMCRAHAVKVADLSAKRDRILLSQFAAGQVSLILQAAQQRDPQGWLLEKLPWESAGMQPSAEKVADVLATPMSALLSTKDNSAKFAQLTAAIESPEPGAKELLSYVSTLFKE